MAHVRCALLPLAQRIVPAAEAAYNVGSDPTERTIAGLSLGSGHAISMLFISLVSGYVGALSAFGSIRASADVNAINEGTKLLRIYTGDIQDFA